MDISDVFSQTRETLTVKRAFGEPYEKNGMTVISAGGQIVLVALLLTIRSIVKARAKRGSQT